MGLDNEDIKQLIAILQKGLTSSEDSKHINNKPKKTNNRKSPKSKTNTPVTNSNFFEQMTEFTMHKDDIEIDKKLNKLPPTARTRNYKPLNVRCRVCGKTEYINPSLIDSIDRYKCNKCSTGAG